MRERTNLNIFLKVLLQFSTCFDFFLSVFGFGFFEFLISRPAWLIYAHFLSASIISWHIFFFSPKIVFIFTFDLCYNFAGESFKTWLVSCFVYATYLPILPTDICSIKAITSFQWPKLIATADSFVNRRVSLADLFFLNSFSAFFLAFYFIFFSFLFVSNSPFPLLLHDSKSGSVKCWKLCNCLLIFFVCFYSNANEA